MSVRTSTFSPRICSGDMYAGDPTICPVEVSSVSPDRSLPIPKSVTFETSPSVSRMFAGLMSRWITPRSWAWARASATSATIRTRSLTERAPGIPSFWDRLPPETYSIAR